MKKLALVTVLSSCLFMFSCGENKKTDVVETGTYQGVAEEVDAGDKEIYVRTSDNKLLELYLTDQTKISKGGQAVTFDNLKQNGKVEVTVKKEGNKLVPEAVNILE
ncbi:MULTISPECIES: hypothetical protein [Bacteroidota]|uniref:Uncharacterized protein n=1 Tax=Pelobium manganitolerans TaxID=1842495 RepID=A0A419S9P5_9SPHI|nr:MULTISPECIES: hypothetical protein [Bacteroidota]MBL7867865.1 hypothetical protein [Flavobacterium lindanitolerans]PZO34859.1 MAG: hypothetical protein DCE86_00835 [Flavobacteriaceae bacterium]RKD18710.1 hypothetical protein BCY91_14575 [Pelobium manganitolerans]